MDNSAVDRRFRFDGLECWRPKNGETVPFYVNTGEVGIVFNGKPETVRDLWRTYSTRKYDTFMEFVSFLNEEGVEARRVSVQMNADKVLGYKPAQLLNN